MRKTLLRAVAVVLFIPLVACSTNWVNEALEIVAAVTPAITNIVPLVALADKNVSASDVATIQNYSNQANTALQTVGSLINQYNQASTNAQQQGALSNIESALQVGQQNLNSILPQLHIVDPTSQAAVAAAVGTVVSEVGSIAALLPALKAGRTADAVSLAKPLTADKFRSRYNSAISPIPGSKRLRLLSRRTPLMAIGHAIGSAFVSR